MTILHPSPQISTGIHSYLLGEEILLFSERAGTIFRLNSSAAFIWCCIEEGLDRTAITDELVTAFNLAAPQAIENLHQILVEWESLGLLNIIGKVVREKPEMEELRNLEHAPEPSTNALQYSLEHRFRILDSIILIRFSENELVQIAHSVLGHLKITGNKTHDIEINVQKDTNGYFLYRDKQLIDYCETEEELGPLIHGHAVQSIYKRTKCLIALHAGAVSNGNRCIVLPAVSGNGKSTLTAALISSGLTYWTDEIVFLQHKTFTINAIPAGIGLKTGAWPVIQPFYPAIDKLPVYLRQDDQYVRYLLPDSSQLCNDNMQPCPISALVFPTYHAKVETSFNAISPADALCRVTEAGYDITGGLDNDKVAELIDWIGQIPCYELKYHDLNQAISRIKSLMQNE